MGEMGVGIEFLIGHGTWGGESKSRKGQRGGVKIVEDG